mmetsp:Transcript_40354/g.94828  ORF Transcript_40354/g.94828 Transcript_40354/m.94828 type:complete len:92 (+) Transcript_40354:797-1072(+)
MEAVKARTTDIFWLSRYIIESFIVLPEGATLLLYVPKDGEIVYFQTSKLLIKQERGSSVVKFLRKEFYCTLITIMLHYNLTSLLMMFLFQN